MTLLTFLCQLISTTTFILMCHLILSKRLPRKITYSLYLYTIFICIFLAPFSGQYGIPMSCQQNGHPDFFTWSDYYFVVS